LPVQPNVGFWTRLASPPIIPGGPTDSGGNFLMTQLAADGHVYLICSDRRFVWIARAEPNDESQWTRVEDSHCHVDPHAMAFTPDFSPHTALGPPPAFGRALLINDGGINISTDGAQTWSNATGLSTLNIVNVAMVSAPDQGPVICIGTGDNEGMSTQDGGVHWETQDYIGGDNDCAFADLRQPSRMIVFAPRSKGPNDIFGEIYRYVGQNGQVPRIGFGTPDRTRTPGPENLPVDPDKKKIAGWNVVSGTSLFASCTADEVAHQPGTNVPDSEVEPIVAVNPLNSQNLVGGWQQDRWSNGGSRGLVAGVSVDGGTSWTQVVIPKITRCSGSDAANGGDFKRATDPWVTFSPNGHVYFFSLSLDIEAPPGFPGGNGKNALFVSKSTNSGMTWGDPIKIIEDTEPRFLDDKQSITADPDNANFVYAVWDRLKLPVGSIINPENVIGFGFQGPAFFSRTTDGGQTWEPARAIYNPGANSQTIGNQIVVLADGTLVDLFNEVLGAKNPRNATFVFNVSLVRSTDRGETWTHGQAIRAAQLLTRAAFDPQGISVRDPETGDPVRTGDIIPQVAADRSPGSQARGALYAVWQDSRFSDFAHDSIAFAKSTDGGFTWSTPIQINKTPTNISSGNQQAFTPSIAIAPDGTIGVTYYDFRNNTAAASLLTDYFIVHCHPATKSCTSPTDWVETKLTDTSFDMRQAPVARGFFTGDYEGLGVAGTKFGAFFSMPHGTDPASVFFRRVGP
jgi:hypothetical protein